MFTFLRDQIKSFFKWYVSKKSKILDDSLGSRIRGSPTETVKPILKALRCWSLESKICSNSMPCKLELWLIFPSTCKIFQNSIIYTFCWEEMMPNFIPGRTRRNVSGQYRAQDCTKVQKKVKTIMSVIMKNHNLFNISA